MKPRFAVRAVNTLRVSYPAVKMSVTVEDRAADVVYELEAWVDVTEEPWGSMWRTRNSWQPFGSQ
jgi:hypothetical protein